MLSEQIIEQLTERLVNRIEKGNEYVLEQIGKSINKIGTLSPSKAQQIAQVLKYGGSYEKIVNKLAEITNMNVQDIYKIFEEVAKHDYRFAKQFYDYRGIDYIPYEKNIALQNQVKALAQVAVRDYVNLSNTLAFTTKDKFGHVVYTDLARTYQNAIDEAVLSVSQGKTTFDEEMYRLIKELGSSGLKTVDYGNRRSMRLDSAIRMNMQGALRNLHNETQKIIGEEFGADGVEISVHSNPAPDHEEAQGRQLSYEEWNKLQTIGVAKTYDGKTINLHRELKRTEASSLSFRPISDYNCQHYKFDIVLGVSKPNYTNEQLQEIIDNNNKGFELDGKHYTNYEGTQLQRKLETEIRKAKDLQIMAKASGNEQLIGEAQQKITALTHKYKELSDVSGLPTKMQRLRVPGYRRTKVNNKNIYIPKINQQDFKMFDIKAPAKDYPAIGKEHFDYPSNDSLDIYVKQGQKMSERMAREVEYRNEMYQVANDIETLKRPVDNNYVLFSGQPEGFDLRSTDFVISTSVGEQTAMGYAATAKNGKVFTIYVEEGAELISTVNTKRKQFNFQGELIIPKSGIKKLVKINKHTYLLKK